MAKQIVIGILAHVDAGKTTLSEAMLYTSGAIRKCGRVDKRDTFLDTDARERDRGITIFSKQARLTYEDTTITLLDTPGHVDFSAEMERTLQVLDYAVLVISGLSGVQGHTLTLWKLLGRYGIPTFLFINKMDQETADHDVLLDRLQTELDLSCVDFTRQDTDTFYENAAMCDEAALEVFLETGKLEREEISRLIRERKMFPCFFGSALKREGIEEFLKGLHMYTMEPTYGEEFGAAVYKIGRDEQGVRLTFLKITGGSLRVRDSLDTGFHKTGDNGEVTEKEKIHQIRLYSGVKYETVPQVHAGMICAVTGPEHTYPHQGLGIQKEAMKPYLEPVLTYSLEFPDGTDKSRMLPKLRSLEEECPELHVVWDEEFGELKVQVMGDVQIEILKSLIEERFAVSAEFSEGRILYKETIADTVEGVGHFEPLRHYAEVHLLLEPLERGSGLVFENSCSEDLLSRNWQRLVLTHLKERTHRGVLMGAAITDIKITLVSGKAHQKHTEGGDFRQATYRAVRQGLMKAQSVLLEPYYSFRIEVPKDMLGRVMTDVEKQGGRFDSPQIQQDTAILEGIGPVLTMRNYQREVTTYTKGTGRCSVAFYGYEVCRNAETVIDETGYDSELDFRQPTGSVFCSHGAGMYVPWDEVEKHMHLPSVLTPDHSEDGSRLPAAAGRNGEGKWRMSDETIGTEEIDAILQRASHANTRSAGNERPRLKSKKPGEAYPVIIRKAPPAEKKEKYLLVDGYNVIFAWEELKELAKDNMDGARGRLLDILCNYQAVRDVCLIVVFDAYRIKGHKTEILDYHNIHVVFTKEAETADQYIEKFTHEHGKKYDITVATSDGLEQIIVTGQGAHLISSRELFEEVRMAEDKIRENL